MNSASDKADDQPNLNTGKNWSEMDLIDLANCVRLNAQ